jgi:hypothetical protein
MDKQQLKKIFFSGTNTFFGKKAKVYKNKNLKDITTVFSNIANMSIYSPIRKRYKIHHAIKMGLLQHHLDFIVYVAYKNGILTIMATNHIGQSELNYQKLSLINHLKKYSDFEDIKKISILRWDKQKRSQGIAEFCFKRETSYKKDETFEEKSYGIFENNLNDTKLYNKMENIRKIIKNLNKIDQED